MLKQFLNDQIFREFYIPDGMDGGESGEGEEGQGKAVKYTEKIDPVSGKKVKLPEELDIVLGHFISTTRAEVEKKYKPVIEALENEKNDLSGIKGEYEKLKESMMTAEERAQSNAKKVIDEHEKKAKAATDELGKWKGLFLEMTVRNDIYSAFEDIKLCNPNQTAIIFEREGEARAEELVDSDGKPTGKWGARVTLSLENDKGEPEIFEGSPKELFKKWIGLDRNAHHILNDIPSGGGSKGTYSKGGKIDFSKLPPKERMDAARQVENNR